MNANREIEREYKSNNLIIRHILSETSKICDYDYDPMRPNRRFIGTFTHKLKFLDSITEENKMTLRFSSETCADMLTTIYKFLYTNPSVVSSVKDVYIDNNLYPITITFSKVLNNKSGEKIIQISYLNKGVYSSVILNDQELESIIEMMESDDIILDAFIDY